MLPDLSSREDLRRRALRFLGLGFSGELGEIEAALAEGFLAVPQKGDPKRGILPNKMFIVTFKSLKLK